MNPSDLSVEAPLTADDVPSNWKEISADMASTLWSLWDALLDHVPVMVAGVICFLLGWTLIRIALAGIDRGLNHSKLRKSLRDLIRQLLSVAMWFVLLLVVAMIMFPELTPTKALSALGLLSIAVGLAFKDIFENFFAGMLILWRFPFENDDYIECDGFVGRVEKITVRMTQLRTVSGELVVLPNAILFKNPVTVLTHRPSRRLRIVCGVAYKEDVGNAVDVIEKAVSDCASVRQDKPIEVLPTEFGASSVDIEVCWWTAPTPGDFRRSRAQIIMAIKAALDKAGIEIPFPYRTLTFDQPLPLASGGTQSAGG